MEQFRNKKFHSSIDTEHSWCYYNATGTKTERLRQEVTIVLLDKNKMQICLARKELSASSLRNFGIGCSTISSAMSEKEISTKTAGRIAKALGVDIIEIVKED